MSAATVRGAEAKRELTPTTADPHAPPRLRVNGELSNMPEFAATFGCEAGSAMVHSPRCEVW